MLNEKVMSVFDAVMTFLSAGDYVIVPKQDVRDSIPDVSQIEIDNALNSLQLNEFIQIRYADNEVYCLTALLKGIRENEKREEKRKEEIERAKRLAEEEERRLALAMEPPPTPPEEEEEKEEKKPFIESIIETVKTPIPFNMKKLALVCGLSSFVGAFIAGMIAVIIILVKVG